MLEENPMQPYTESALDFELSFASLQGSPPFPWQQALYREFIQERFPGACGISTGLGKTAIMAIWVLALAQRARNANSAGFPRRLIYVVNRRTVVDQATREAEKVREALETKPELQAVANMLRTLACRPSSSPLAISTLRGQFADNAEWRDDPARPAIVVGTVDMVGSRLLFSGYGCGFKSRPLHAGFLGQDSLLVHDEAHLEPAFQELIEAIKSEQRRCGEFRTFRVMELSATSRDDDRSWGLTTADLDNRLVRKRVAARKGVSFRRCAEKALPDEFLGRAISYEKSGQAVLIFLRKLDHLQQLTDRLRKRGLSVQTLTGTLRGLERDQLAKTDRIFARYMPTPEIAPLPGTVYLVCTSAGEVGINISADHLICDLTPFDSMAQRFGRVNRFGEGDAEIDVIHTIPEEKWLEAGTDASANGVVDHDEADETGFDRACRKTLALLKQLPRRDDQRHDACPAALNDLPVMDRLNAFTPPPAILQATDILFDSWTLTSIRQKLPNRPSVTRWLHGVSEWEPPATFVGWREEPGVIEGELLEKYHPGDLLDDFPLKPHELLRDRTTRVFAELEELAERHPSSPVWLIEPNGDVKVFGFSELVKRNKQNKPIVDLSDCTVLLPPEVGGLQPTAGGCSMGLLTGESVFIETHRSLYDVAESWQNENGDLHRCRTWDNAARPQGMRLVRTIDTWHYPGEESAEGGETSSRRYWHWYVRPRSADDDGSQNAEQPQELVSHLHSTECFAALLGHKLSLPHTERFAIKLAARWHDRGKRRAVWQRAIGNAEYPEIVLAKSGGGTRSLNLSNYRHELGSLIEIAMEVTEFRDLMPDIQDLVLHLIAAHHGRARPHFSADEAFDLERKQQVAAEILVEVPRRFARLQRRYGRWGLAYLESLLRAADAMASQVRDKPELQLPGHAEITEKEAD